jgi:predicted lipoprotein with Yx(FWY)xxD motif
VTRAISGRRLLRSSGLVILVSLWLAVVSAAGAPTRGSVSVAGPALMVGKSRFGPILFDGRGYALYSFTHDPRGRTTCYRACAKAWPPYVVRARPTARTGARASLVRTTHRRDGRSQATYAGRPLYYYRGDDRPGVILCQNVSEFGGLWLVLRGSGKPVR